MPESKELASFRRAAKKLRVDVADFIARSWEYQDRREVEAAERKLIARRDRLFDTLKTKIGVGGGRPDEVAALAEHEATVDFMRGFRERAAERRKEFIRAASEAAELRARAARPADPGLAAYQAELRLAEKRRAKRGV